MKIQILSLLQGARRAKGVVVIVDVYRAFTTAAVAFRRGAHRIVMVDRPVQALALREQGRGDLCMGEVDGMKFPGFDYGNSPWEISTAPLQGKTLIQSTGAGTRGVVAAAGAEAVFAAALVNAAATAAAVAALDAERVSIVALGTRGEERSDEDELCAMYLRNLLLGFRPEQNAIQALLRTSADAAKFDDATRPHFDPRDRELALQVDSIDLAIRVRREGGLRVAKPLQKKVPNDGSSNKEATQ